ncbi:hypothetical protein [Arthrobacter pigmenti]
MSGNAVESPASVALGAHQRKGVVLHASRPGLLHSADSAVPLVQSSPFDVRDFTRTAFGDRRNEVAAEAFTQAPLQARVLRAVTFLWNAERAATDTLRRVLATSTAREARFTAFLTTWAHDKYWFAGQLEQILVAHGVSTNFPLPRGTSRQDRREYRLDQLSRYVDPVWTTLAGEPVAALHASQGLAAETAELTAYSRVLELADSDVLRGVFDPVMTRKARHRDFFDAEAQMRLANDRRARLLTRSLLTFGFHPLRPGNLPVAESHWFLRFLFTSDAKARVVDGSDSAVRILPGMGPRGPLEATLRRERPIG